SSSDVCSSDLEKLVSVLRPVRRTAPISSFGKAVEGRRCGIAEVEIGLYLDVPFMGADPEGLEGNHPSGESTLSPLQVVTPDVYRLGGRNISVYTGRGNPAEKVPCDQRYSYTGRHCTSICCPHASTAVTAVIFYEKGADMISIYYYY